MRKKRISKEAVMQRYLLAMMLVLAFVTYKSFTDPLPTRQPDAQFIENSVLPSATPGPPPTATGVAHGEPLVLMEIPRFGDEWAWMSFEGVDDEVVAKGPGHYPSTVLPGEQGNTAFAAHRASHGDPFIDFEELQLGDEVILSQSDEKWTYIVTEEPEIIESDERWVLDNYGGKTLTLTTCWPKYGTEKRLFIRAELVDGQS